MSNIQMVRDTDAFKAIAQSLCPRDRAIGAGVVRVGGIEADFTRHLVDGKLMDALVAFAAQENLTQGINNLLSGARVNVSEGRAALHTALRGETHAPADVAADVAATVERMRALVAKVDAAGRCVRHIIHIGIGGSLYGPKLVYDACRAGQSTLRDVHFVSNIDPIEVERAMAACDPKATLVVLASKSFTTLETMVNAKVLRAWLKNDSRMVACTANPAAAREFGLSDENILPFWDFVGGRFSVWSSVGLTVALAFGWRAFADMLAGAADVDVHFASAPLHQNVPVLMALLFLLYRNYHDAPGLAVVPYAADLSGLPLFLQQLDMESLGKRVTRDCAPVTYKTGGIVFGQAGSDAQHAFCQALHQGTETIPVDIIGVRAGVDEARNLLRTNLMAQSKALWEGCTTSDPAKDCPGARPNTVLWLDDLSPRCVGSLIALYEHKIFTLGHLWRINPFDQYGVQLAKSIVSNMLAA